MRDEEAFVFLTLCGGFVLLVLWIRNGHGERMRRLTILQQALQDPRVDAGTRQELVRKLDRPALGGVLEPWRKWLIENATPRRVFATLAWGCIVGGGMAATFGGRYDFIAGMSFVGVGLGVLALPFILRELDARAVRR